MTWLFIAIGSALGGVARHAMGIVIAQRLGTGFPWGTVAVNVIGSLVMGILGAIAAGAVRESSAQIVRELLMIGFLGGFTTFSAFSLQTLQLMRDGKLMFALANVGASLFLCLLAVWAGYFVGGRFGVTV